MGSDQVAGIRPQDTAPPSPLVYVDVTTSWQETRRIPHGTTRVERGLVGALAASNIANLAFCRFDKALERFLPVSREEALAATMQPGVAEPRREARSALHQPRLRDIGRSLERWTKQHVRERWRAMGRKMGAPLSGSPNSPDQTFATGSMLLLPGELQRHDFRVLLRLRRAGVRLGFVFYDLHTVLAANDPRAADPDATNIPGTEFMLRHGEVLFAISQFSRSELMRHAASRAVATPPIKVFRLGQDMRRFAGEELPVPGLSPQSFVLAVGDVVPRKNYELLLGVWRDLHERLGAHAPVLVIAGRVGAEGTPFAQMVHNDASVRDRIRILANVDDRSLLWLYRHCRFTVFPSLVEGFGLPVAESLAMGKACIASSSTSIPEASGGLALHLDPTDTASWSRAVASLWSDAEELARQEQAIAERYVPVTWRDSANDVLNEMFARAACR